MHQVLMHFWRSNEQLWTVSVDLIYALRRDILFCSAVQLQHRHSLQTVLCGTWQTPPEASFEKGYLVCPLSYFRSASLSGLASL